MQIAVLGIDLGKNSCSVVGLDAAGRVVLRRRLPGPIGSPQCAWHAAISEANRTAWPRNFSSAAVLTASPATALRDRRRQ